MSMFFDTRSAADEAGVEPFLASASRHTPTPVRAPEPQGLAAMLGDSPAMARLKERVQRVAQVDAMDGGPAPAVLIVGETGTGKELVARACHQEGPRRTGPFVEVNCAAIPGYLLESELFGHERGAFTDAKERKIGLIEAAHGGTLFLDEIGEADLAIQAKLLKVLEDRKIRRVGSVQEREVDIRIIAATNQPLAQRVEQGLFRADLLYRLRVISLLLPPLRERGNDVTMLSERFLASFARRYARPGLRLSGEAHAAICHHTWPGNVRELRNTLEQAALLCAGDEVLAEDLLLPGSSNTADTSNSGLGNLTSWLPPTSGMGDLTHTLPTAPKRLNDPAATSMTLPSVELDLIRHSLSSTGWNVSKSAVLLGISRDTLRYRIERLGLSRHANAA